MKPGILASRAINQYRTRDVIPYLALRYYLENSCARSDQWASEVAVHLTQTRNLPTYFEAQHFKETQGNGQVLHRSILLPGPNEALSEAVLLSECSKYDAFEPMSCVYSYRLAKQGDRSGTSSRNPQPVVQHKVRETIEEEEDPATCPYWTVILLKSTPLEPALRRRFSSVTLRPSSGRSRCSPVRPST